MNHVFQPTHCPSPPIAPERMSVDYWTFHAFLAAFQGRSKKRNGSGVQWDELKCLMCLEIRKSAKCWASSGDDGSRCIGKVGCAESAASRNERNLASQIPSSMPESVMAFSRAESDSRARKLRAHSCVSAEKINGYLGAKRPLKKYRMGEDAAN